MITATCQPLVETSLGPLAPVCQALGKRAHLASAGSMTGGGEEMKSLICVNGESACYG
jgi:hypothetical protein